MLLSYWECQPYGLQFSFLSCFVVIKIKSQCKDNVLILLRNYNFITTKIMFGALLGSVLGAGGSLLGSLGKDQQISDKQHGINKMSRENQAWFSRRYNEDPTQRADALRLLSMTEDALRKRNRAAEGRKAVMGGTEESVAAEREASSNALANVTSQIAVQNERRKDQIEQQFRNRKNKLDEQYNELEGERPNAYDIAGGMIGGATNGYKLGSGLG